MQNNTKPLNKKQEAKLRAFLKTLGDRQMRVVYSTTDGVTKIYNNGPEHLGEAGAVQHIIHTAELYDLSYRKVAKDLGKNAERVADSDVLEDYTATL